MGLGTSCYELCAPVIVKNYYVLRFIHICYFSLKCINLYQIKSSDNDNNKNFITKNKLSKYSIHKSLAKNVGGCRPGKRKNTVEPVN